MGRAVPGSLGRNFLLIKRKRGSDGSERFRGDVFYPATYSQTRVPRCFQLTTTWLVLCNYNPGTVLSSSQRVN